MSKKTIKKDRIVHRDKTLGRYNEQKYRDALAYIEELELKTEAVRRLANAKRTHVIQPSANKGVDEATVVAVLSDVHIGAEVRPEQVQGLNQYSIEIARKRVDQFFQKIARLADKERQDVTINELVLFLGGDIIDGALHLDTIMSNEISEPMRQAVLAQSWIESGLLFLEKHFSHITVVCADGNHGRVTHRIHAASRQGNSLEYFMYYNLSARLPQFTWIVNESLHTYLTFYKGYPGERTIRFHHGDTISYGGVNGPFTYLNRRRYQWNIAKHADIDVLGHLHMYRATLRFIINGSVVGHNSFGVSIGAEFEPPMQAFFLMDRKRGMTVNIPILFSV